MGARAIVVLVLVVAALAAALLLTDEKVPVERVAVAPVLDGRSLRDSVRLRWQLREREPVEIGRAPDGRFQLQEPFVDIASAAHLKQIVDAWDSAQMHAAPLADDEHGREQAGLAPPELVFTAEWADGPPLRIEVGAPGPLGTTRFLRVHGKIWEGGEALLESMRVGLDDLRERAVFRHGLAQVQELRVRMRPAEGKSETIHLRLDQGTWRLLAPIEARADPVEAQRFVTAVLSLRVDFFHVGPMRMPAGEPRVEITATGAFGEEHCKLWQEQGQLVGVLPGRDVVFLSDHVQYAHVFENATDRLRARILVPMPESAFTQMVELVVDPGQGRGDRLRLLRTTPALPWRLVEPVEYPAAATPPNEAVLAVQLLVAREFVDDADAVRPRAQDPRYGLLPATRTAVLVRGVADAAPVTLWFGAEASRGDQALVYACRADDPDTVVLVQQANVAALRRSWLDYCALDVVRQSAGVDRLELERDGTIRAFQVEDGVWRRVGDPAERREVGELVNDLLLDLTGTKAVDARGEAFATPDWQVHLARRGGDRLDTIRVWDRGPGEPLVVQRARPEQPPVAFVISKLISDQLRALWQ